VITLECKLDDCLDQLKTQAASAAASAQAAATAAESAAAATSAMQAHLSAAPANTMSNLLLHHPPLHPPPSTMMYPSSVGGYVPAYDPAPSNNPVYYSQLPSSAPQLPIWSYLGSNTQHQQQRTASSGGGSSHEDVDGYGYCDEYDYIQPQRIQDGNIEGGGYSSIQPAVAQITGFRGAPVRPEVVVPGRSFTPLEPGFFSTSIKQTLNSSDENMGTSGCSTGIFCLKYRYSFRSKMCVE